MSGEGGREVQAKTQRQQGRQYRSQVSFVAASEASTGGIKVGGLVKRVRRFSNAVPLQLSDDISRQLP
jgi:hypothetical protein